MSETFSCMLFKLFLILKKLIYPKCMHCLESMMDTMNISTVGLKATLPLRFLHITVKKWSSATRLPTTDRVFVPFCKQ